MSSRLSWPLAILVVAAGCPSPDDGGMRLRPGDPLGDHLLEGGGDCRIRTSEFASRVLLIHFFDPGSDESMAQVRQIKGLWFPKRASGMNVIGVCPESGREEILRAVKEGTLTYPVFLDPDREFARKLAPRQYPWNVVVGRDGKILLSERGDWSRVRSAVEEAVAVRVAGPDRVSVHHLLIAAGGERSSKEAGRLAREAFRRAKEGEDLGELVREYTSDERPGIYSLVNFHVEPDDDLGETERGVVSLSLGDVAFSLDVGEIGMTEHHPIKSPRGWHIIKRLK